VFEGKENVREMRVRMKSRVCYTSNNSSAIWLWESDSLSQTTFLFQNLLLFNSV